jgi:hypothetical protein
MAVELLRRSRRISSIASLLAITLSILWLCFVAPMVDTLRSLGATSTAAQLLAGHRAVLAIVVVGSVATTILLFLKTSWKANAAWISYCHLAIVGIITVVCLVVYARVALDYRTIDLIVFR